MSSVTISPPQSDEAAPFYHGYIARVTDDDLGAQLERQIHQLEQLFENVTDSGALACYAEGKWSIKEVVGPSDRHRANLRLPAAPNRSRGRYAASGI